MKNFFKLTLAVALLVIGANTASAQKFGRVDLAAIVPNMPEYKEAEANLETYEKDLQNQLELIMVEFNQKYADYEKNKATFTDTIRQMKEAELQQLQQRYMEFQQIAYEDIQKQKAELLEPVYAKADEAVKKVAAAGGYIVVFNTAGDQPSSAGLAYFDAKALVDITAAVKQELGITE